MIVDPADHHYQNEDPLTRTGSGSAKEKVFGDASLVLNAYC
jgi:hypothetical protein